MTKLPLLCIVVMILPIAQATSLELSTDLVKQGQVASATFSILSEAKFTGAVYLTYENIASAINMVNFNENNFVGAGPYIFTYSWDVKGIDKAPYSISATLTNSTGTIISQASTSGSLNSSAPIITSKSPSGIITERTTTLEVKTNEKAICKYGSENKTYNDMSSKFTITEETTHSQVITDLEQGQTKYFIRCMDMEGYAMEDSATITFVVDLPPSAEISLSDESPIKSGTVEVTLITSEKLEKTPSLYYSFNDAPDSMRIVSLTGEGKDWAGYLIIKDEDDNKVGTFHFKGEDSQGTIGELVTEGKIFLVDTAKPPAPINTETSVLPDGDIKLRWYYNGEPVKNFNIYRSTESGVNYIDFYTTTENFSYYRDASTSNKVTYYYKVSAVDEAGNLGPLSEEVYATSLKLGEAPAQQSTQEAQPEEPKVLPPNLVLQVNDWIKKVEQLEIDVKDVHTKFENTDTDTKDLMTDLNFFATMDEAQSTITGLKDKLEGLKETYRTSDELSSELNTIDLEMKKIRRKTPKEVSLLEKTEFIQSISWDDTENAVLQIFPEFTQKERTDYITKNSKIQKNTNIESKIKVVSLEYLDETKKEQTLIQKKISYLEPDEIGDVIIVEDIPKSITDTTQNIFFQTEGYSIVKDDPLVKWGFVKLDYEGETIEYIIDKKVPLNTAKEAKSILLVGPVQLEQTSNVVGFSIMSLFDNSTFSSSEKVGIWIGIIIIGLLSGYYFIVMKGNNVWVKEKISTISGGLKSKQSKLAMHQNFPHLTKIASQKILRQRKDEATVISELISEAQGYISADDYDKAASLYPRIELLYKNLPSNLKTKIYPQCAQIQKSIKEGNKEFYQSIL
jgi:hypothetical protein